jgi:hypothetical protein
MNGILLPQPFCFYKGLLRPTSLLPTQTRSFFVYVTPTLSFTFVCRFPCSHIPPLLWPCPLLRLPLATTCGFLPIVPRTSLVITHTPAPITPYTENGSWYVRHISAVLFGLTNHNQTTVDYRLVEPSKGLIRGVASSAVRSLLSASCPCLFTREWLV